MLTSKALTLSIISVPVLCSSSRTPECFIHSEAASIRCLLLNMQTDLPSGFLFIPPKKPYVRGMVPAIGTALIIPCGAGGHIVHTFKAVPSPYVLYDNLLSAIPDSGSLPILACGNNFLFPHQLARCLIQQVNTLEVMAHN